MRFDGKVVVVVGAGQTTGESIGNGRAAASLYAEEGAKVFAVDLREDAAEDTAAAITAAGHTAVAFRADATQEADVEAMVRSCLELWGRIDVLHNNVGVSIAGGDAPLTELDSDAFDRVVALNLKTAFLTCKHVVPVMREQGGGAIVNISSLAAVIDYPNIAYKTAKAGINALTTQTAVMNAAYGIRCNAIMPGQIDTPMAVENRVGRDGMSRDEVRAMFDSIVPLQRKMGTAWDVAKAAAFLASDDARFITGVLLPVDGGQSLQIGGQGLRTS